MLRGAPRAQASFEQLRVAHLLDRLSRTAAALRGLAEIPSARVRHLEDGQVVCHQGDPAEAAWVIASGTALAVDPRPSQPVVLSRRGPGQIFGEVALLRGRPRNATVVADGPLELVEIPAAEFRAWHRREPSLQALFGALAAIYERGDGSAIAVYEGEHEGHPSAIAVQGDPTRDGLISTRVVDQDLVILRRGAPGPEEEQIDFTDADTGRRRTLFLEAKARDPKGKISEARLVGVVAHPSGIDVAHLYERLDSGASLNGTAVRRFQRTGYVGGDALLRDPERICTCLRLDRGTIRRAAEEHEGDAEAVLVATGAGALCGACVPDVRAMVQAESVGATPKKPSPTERSGVGQREGAASASSDAPVAGLPRPRPSRPKIVFDADALRALASTPQLQLVAVASVFAAVGERLAIRQISAAIPALKDPALIAHAESFLEQEANHIELHAPLNELLMNEVFPSSRALRRVSEGPLLPVHRLPPRLALGIVAAFEHVADVSFSSFLGRVYSDPERRLDPSPEVDALLRRSGISPLYLWHGAEELGHRHVAFSVLEAIGGGGRHRVFGFSALLFEAFALLIPAQASLWWCAPPAPLRARLALLAGGAGMTAEIIAKSLAFLRPGFHPAHSDYPFLDELERDVAALEQSGQARW